MLFPVRGIDAVIAHALAGRGRVDEAAVAEVDADMRVLLAFEVEEDEVAAPQAREPHRARDLALRVGAARQIHADLPIAVLHEAAAVEAGGYRGAAEVVRTAAHGRRLCCGALAERGADFRRSRVPSARARAGGEEDRQQSDEEPFHRRGCYASGTNFAQSFV